MVRFFYQTAATAQEQNFRCALKCSRCMARNRHGSGPQCKRYSFRHPFCLQHTKEKLGVEIRPSGIHGCGLFALRTFKKGDVIVPYTGDASSRAFMVQTQHRNGSPYGIALAGGHWVDAACLRGLGAYMNGSSHNRGQMANVYMTQAKFDLPADECLFGPNDQQTGLRTLTVPSRHRRPIVTNRLYSSKGWRRIPADLVLAMNGVSYMWLVAKRQIVQGEELLLNYGNNNVNRYIHRTTPLPC